MGVGMSEGPKKETRARHTMARSHAREGVLIAALLAGSKVEDAARLAGISRRQAQRVLKTEEFRRAFSEAKGELLSGAVAALHNHAGDFVATLHTLATDVNARGNDRVQAAYRGFDLMLKSVEVLDLEERIGRLEQVAGEGQK